MLGIDRMPFVCRYEAAELLDGGDDDARVRVLELPLQHCRRAVGVGRAFFEALVFAHGLVVQILTVHHKKHLVDTVQQSRQLRRFETGQRLPAPGGVPDVAACADPAQLPVIGGRCNALQNPFGRDDLIGPHYQQLAVDVENAIAGQDVEKRVPGEKRLGKTGQLGDGLISGISPPAGERKTVGSLLPAAFAALLRQVALAHRVAVGSW